MAESSKSVENKIQDIFIQRLAFMYESNPRVPMPPGHLTFFISFGQIPHHAGPFFGQMSPSLGIF